VHGGSNLVQFRAPDRQLSRTIRAETRRSGSVDNYTYNKK